MPPLPHPVIDDDITVFEHYRITLDRWHSANRLEANADLVKLLFFKVTAVVVAFLGYEFCPRALAALLCIAAMCLVMDALLRPGCLYGVHRYAMREIEQLRSTVLPIAIDAGDVNEDLETRLNALKTRQSELVTFLKEAETTESSYLPLWLFWKEPGGSLTSLERRRLGRAT